VGDCHAAKWLDNRVKKTGGFKAGGAGAGNAAGGHDGVLAHDDNQAAAYAKLVLERIGYRGYRARYQDGVEFSGAPAGVGIAHLHRDIGDLVALQVFLGEGGQLAVDLDAGDLLGQAGQQGGLVARAGADFKHAVCGFELQLLRQAGFHLGRKHDLAGVDGVDHQGQLDIGKGEAFHGRGHIAFTPDVEQGLQDAGIEHFPGADLLLDHVESSLLDFGKRGDVHGFYKIQG
jgi:hypothetical protein